MAIKDKKQLILRIPHTLWEELNKLAEDEYRSLNGQIEYILVNAVRNKRTKQKIVLEEVISNLAENDTPLNIRVNKK